MRKLDAILNLYSIKNVKREGWRRIGLTSVESVSDHSYMMTLLILLLKDEFDGLDQCKLLQLAVLHDLAEVEIGDVVWETSGQQNLKLKADKDKLELNSLNKILPESITTSISLQQLIVEYLNKSSPEARLVQQIDKLEMVLQALVYYQSSRDERTYDFLITAKKYITHPALKKIFNQAESMFNL